MIVVDTNVMVYLWVPSRDTAAAEALLVKDPEWAAPVLWRSEFRNALIGYVRRRMLSIGDAQHIIREAEEHMHAHEYAVSSDAVLLMANSSPCSAYDCEFVVLAQELQLPLVTADRQIVSAFPAVARDLAKYTRS